MRLARPAFLRILPGTNANDVANKRNGRCALAWRKLVAARVRVPLAR
jgi:hypothetical protein